MNYATALLDAREMEEADRLPVVAGTSVSQSMENAGRGVAQEILQRWPARRVTVLCGPGNNGGDDFIAARLLAEAGWNVTVASLGTLECLQGAARQHAEKWRGGLEAITPHSIDSAELIVDALSGAGLSRPLASAAKETLAAAHAGAFRSLLLIFQAASKGTRVRLGRGQRGAHRHLLSEKAMTAFADDPSALMQAIGGPSRGGWSR